MVNQFSFWPRYDEFVAAAGRTQLRDPNEIYTEEQGVNLFTGRTALLSPARETQRPAAQHSARLRTHASRSPRSRCGPVGRLLRELQVFACYDYRTMPL